MRQHQCTASRTTDCVSVSMDAGCVTGKGCTSVALLGQAWHIPLVAPVSLCHWFGIVRMCLGYDECHASISEASARNPKMESAVKGINSTTVIGL